MSLYKSHLTALGSNTYFLSLHPILPENYGQSVSTATIYHNPANGAFVITLEYTLEVIMGLSHNDDVFNLLDVHNLHLCPYHSNRLRIVPDLMYQPDLYHFVKAAQKDFNLFREEALHLYATSRATVSFTQSNSGLKPNGAFMRIGDDMLLVNKPTISPHTLKNNASRNLPLPIPTQVEIGLLKFKKFTEDQLKLILDAVIDPTPKPLEGYTFWSYGKSFEKFIETLKTTTHPTSKPLDGGSLDSVIYMAQRMYKTRLLLNDDVTEGMHRLRTDVESIETHAVTDASRSLVLIEKFLKLRCPQVSSVFMASRETMVINLVPNYLPKRVILSRKLHEVLDPVEFYKSSGLSISSIMISARGVEVLDNAKALSVLPNQQRGARAMCTGNLYASEILKNGLIDILNMVDCLNPHMWTESHFFIEYLKQPKSEVVHLLKALETDLEVEV